MYPLKSAPTSFTTEPTMQAFTFPFPARSIPMVRRQLGCSFRTRYPHGSLLSAPYSFSIVKNGQLTLRLCCVHTLLFSPTFSHTRLACSTFMLASLFLTLSFAQHNHFRIYHDPYLFCAESRGFSFVHFSFQHNLPESRKKLFKPT